MAISKIKVNNTEYGINADTVDGKNASDFAPATHTTTKASSSTLGHVKAPAKTDEQTQEIGIDTDGKLWTLPARAIIYGTCGTGGSTPLKAITLTNAPNDWTQPFKYIFAIKYTNPNTTREAGAIISGTAYAYRYEGASLNPASLFAAGRAGTVAYYYIGDDKTFNWLGDTSATQAQFTNEQVVGLANAAILSGFTSSISAGGLRWSVTRIGYPNDSTARTFAIATVTGTFSASPTDETSYNITLPIAFNTTYANCFLSSSGTWKNWEQVGAYQLWLTSSTNARLTLYTNQGGTKYFKITVMGTI